MQTHMRFTSRLTVAFVLVALLVRPALSANETPNLVDSLISAADLLKIKQLGAPALSPDGASVIYTVKAIIVQPDKKGEYSYQTRLWLAATDGHTAPRELTRGEANASSPQWSPDGRREAFALTKLESGATNPRWSPDGTRLAFTSSLSETAVRQELEKLHAKSLQPEWSLERPNRKAGDTADWFDKSKDLKRPAASTDGTRQEQREWLAENEADGNPRLINRLNFIGESDLEPRPSFTNLYVIEAHEGATPLALSVGRRRRLVPRRQAARLQRRSPGRPQP